MQQNFTIQRPDIQNFDDFDIRGDWLATERDQAFVRFSFAQDPETTTTRLPGLPAGFGSGSQFTDARGAGIGYTHTFGPTLLSDLRLGFQRTFLGYTPPYDNVALSAGLGIPNANTSPLLGGGALIGGYNSQLEYTGDYVRIWFPENTYQVAETMSWIKGNHSFKFGANFIRRQVNLFRPLAGKGYFFLFGNGSGPGSTGYETADVLAGFVNNYQIGPPYGMVGTRSWENGVFAQDDWRVTRRLTLNLGLRWDYLSNPTEVFGRQANFEYRHRCDRRRQRRRRFAGEQQLAQFRTARGLRLRRGRQGEDRDPRRLRYLLLPGPRRHQQSARAEPAVQRRLPVQLQRRLSHHLIGGVACRQF